MDLKVDPEQINKFMADKLIESALGKVLKDELDQQVRKVTSSYDSPIKGIIQSYIREATRQLLETHFKDEIESAIRAALTTEKISELAKP